MEIRLDNLVSIRKNISRSRAQTLIKEGKVEIKGRVIDKPSFLIDENENVEINNNDSYVSRGAYKLKKALQVFDVDVQGKVVLDMGASTGGFTQVCLENGAEKVYSVDVGKGELSPVLSQDDRVINMEGTDIRNLAKEDVKDVDLVVGDLSFISLKHILPKVNMLLGKIQCILLFKPQFECGKEIAKKSRGVVKDKSIHKRLLKEFLEEIKIYNYHLTDSTFSPIKGKSGNVEYLIHLNGNTEKNLDIQSIVDEAFSKAN